MLQHPLQHSSSTTHTQALSQPPRSSPFRPRASSGECGRSAHRCWPAAQLQFAPQFFATGNRDMCIAFVEILRIPCLISSAVSFHYAWTFEGISAVRLADQVHDLLVHMAKNDRYRCIISSTMRWCVSSPFSKSVSRRRRPAIPEGRDADRPHARRQAAWNDPKSRLVVMSTSPQVHPGGSDTFTSKPQTSLRGFPSVKKCSLTLSHPEVTSQE
jgi:hypothetical protein